MWITLLKWIARFLLGAAMLLAAIAKIPDPAAFQIDILNYQLAPVWLAAATALFLPYFELVCGLVLITGFRPLYRAALWSVVGLLIIFVFAYVSTLIRGIDISCGCFGEITREWAAWKILARDAILLAFGGFLVWAEHRPAK
jgi:hypothetical protein